MSKNLGAPPVHWVYSLCNFLPVPCGLLSRLKFITLWQIHNKASHHVALEITNVRLKHNHRRYTWGEKENAVCGPLATEP